MTDVTPDPAPPSPELVPDVELGEGEHLIEAGDEQLFRQITKHHLGQDGKLGSHAFGPADADKGRPSFARSSATNAQASRDWHTQNARSASLGVWAVTSGEVVLAKTFAIDDQKAPLAEGQKRAPGHCFVDYRTMPDPQMKTVRGILLRFALSRGELHTVAEAPSGELRLPVEPDAGKVDDHS